MSFNKDLTAQCELPEDPLDHKTLGRRLGDLKFDELNRRIVATAAERRSHVGVRFSK